MPEDQGSWQLPCNYYTVNGERFAGLNFCGFQGYRERFSVNIYKLHIMALFKCFKSKALRKFSREKLHWVESMKV